MVDIHTKSSLTPSNVTDVASLDDLAKLAERFNTMILHTGESNMHTYYVQSNGITYRFRLSNDKTEAAVPAYETPNPGGKL
jgi:phage protein U